MEKNIFEKIIAGEIPATIEYEDEHVVAIRDIAPSARVHLLVIPRKAIHSLDAATDDDAPLLGHILLVAARLARAFGVADDGYRVVTNVNSHGGQTVFHIHFHVLGGEPLGRMNTRTEGHSDKGAGMRGVLMEAGLFVVAALGLALVYNSFFSTKPIKLVRQAYDIAPVSDSILQRLFGIDTIGTAAPVGHAANGVKLPHDKSPNNTIAINATGAAKPNDSAPRSEDVGATKSSRVDIAPTIEPDKTITIPTGGSVNKVQVRMLIQRSDVQIVDARTPERFSAGRIGNALNFYGAEVQSVIPQLLSTLDKNKTIIVYCDGGQCDLSHNVIDVLRQFGYQRILLYEGGWEDWTK